MAPRSRRSNTKSKKNGTRRRPATAPPVQPSCAFCDRPHYDSEIGGELLSSGALHVHYMCMLFSSGLHQRGKESDVLRGFVEADVKAELRRGSRLSCSFCKLKGATVGCCLRACKKVFHMPCGVGNGCLLQFFGDFRVYCGTHRPRQNVVPMVSATALCPICSEEMAHPSINVLVTPCCRHLFHRVCVQRQAMSAGSHFFRCGHCNNQEAFQREMQEHGIYVPEQDASWEREPHAFEDLLFQYRHCDAPLCHCPYGRTHDQESGAWRILICNGCGSQGVHSSCGHKANAHWVCPDCCKVIRRRERPTRSLATPTQSSLIEPVAKQPRGSFGAPASQSEPPKETAEPVEVIEIDDDNDGDNASRQAPKSPPADGRRVLDFAMRGDSSTNDDKLQLTLEMISGSVIVAVVAKEPAI